MEKMMDHKPMGEKDMAEARGLVAKLKMLADKCDTSVEHLVEMASDQEGMEYEEGEDGEEGEGMGAGPDKSKVALIIAKMKGQKAEEE